MSGSWQHLKEILTATHERQIYLNTYITPLRYFRKKRKKSEKLEKERDL